MKTCPVCGAKAFDDAERCYGCLYDFGSGTPSVGGAGAVGGAAGAGAGVVGGAGGAARHVLPPEATSASGMPVGGAAQEGGASAPPFLIRFTPTAEPSGAIAWRCAVELG